MKEKIQKLWASEDFKQLVGYVLIGLLGLVVDFGVFLILTHFFNFNVEWANFISSSCGLINNFIWNSFANFKVHDKLLLRFISYYLVGQVTTLFTTLCLFIFVTKLGYDKFVVKVIATFVATLIQFVINKVITFRKDQSNTVA
ncbi:GtrA family protein [Lactobacillus rodentium]|uniref:GtrA-like protein n=1 Tax=Lactobacillus rodentium TaxID=947835 RepID=A0A2Z6TRF0_9LACO|nr:GtrA family protein [Lactobacillus rodentium]MCR1895128.1 GtrA family protein [Lactobacillus rodentium]GBG05407.1 GtrA-like protein [Lactobacillus rodentium]